MSRESLAVAVDFFYHLSRKRLAVKGSTAKCLPTDIQMRYFECLVLLSGRAKQQKKTEIVVSIRRLTSFTMIV